MKPRTDPKTLLALLLALTTAPALADESAYGMFAPALAKIAQLSPEERRALRERWEQAGPEERLRLRREFQERQERLRQMPPEGRREAMDAWRNLPPAERERRRQEREIRGPRGHEEEGSYGTGFERRRFEEGRFENPAPLPNPGEFFDRRHNRGRQ